MALNIKPLADRVLVEPMEAETKTASGIIIPDNAKEKPQKGTVVATGKGTKDEPITVKVGDTVLYGKYGGTELKLEGKDFNVFENTVKFLRDYSFEGIVDHDYIKIYPGYTRHQNSRNVIKVITKKLQYG